MKITIVSESWCVYCKILKDVFDRNHITYTSVSQDSDIGYTIMTESRAKVIPVMKVEKPGDKPRYFIGERAVARGKKIAGEI